MSVIAMYCLLIATYTIGTKEQWIKREYRKWRIKRAHASRSGSGYNRHEVDRVGFGPV
jgi:hypothetical protein